MIAVHPIKNMKILNLIKNKLNDRDKFMITIGFNTGLRISDILKLKVKDIKNNSLNIIINKTKKSIEIDLLNIRFDIDNYIKDMNNEDYLFKSRKGINQPISRFQAWNILHQIGKHYNLNLGTHSMRKTFGYYYLKNNKLNPHALAELQLLLGHANGKETLSYCGLDDIEIVNNISNLKL
jgi:integrase